MSRFVKCFYWGNFWSILSGYSGRDTPTGNMFPPFPPLLPHSLNRRGSTSTSVLPFGVVYRWQKDGRRRGGLRPPLVLPALMWDRLSILVRPLRCLSLGPWGRNLSPGSGWHRIIPGLMSSNGFQFLSRWPSPNVSTDKFTPFRLPLVPIDR